MSNNIVGKARHNYKHGRYTRDIVTWRQTQRLQKNLIRKDLELRVSTLFRELKKMKENGFFEGDIYESIVSKLRQENKSVTKGVVAGVLNRVRSENGNEDL